MAYPRLAARFFVSPTGLCHEREQRDLRDSVKDAIWRRDRSRCRVCRGKLDPYAPVCSPFWRGLPKGSVDHILPVSRGGTHDPDNLRLVCHHFNMARKADARNERAACRRG